MSEAGEAGPGDDAMSIARLVQELAGTRRRATDEEVDHLLRFFADTVLLNVPRSYAHEKHEQHAIDNEEWPPGTGLDEYLSSLRAAVHDPGASVRLYYDQDYGGWNIMFAAPSRDWEGPEGFSHIVVLFNGERGWWVTGFQPEAGLQYVVRQGGLWIWRPR